MNRPFRRSSSLSVVWLAASITAAPCETIAADGSWRALRVPGGLAGLSNAVGLEGEIEDWRIVDEVA